MTRIPALFFFLFGLTYYSCSNYTKISSIDIAQVYSSEKSKLHPEIYVKHSNDNFSIVNIEIPSSELFYSQNATENFYTARYNVKLNLWVADDKSSVLFQMDSAFTDTLQNDLLQKVRQSIKIPLVIGENYLLHVKLKDLHKRTTADKIIHINKRSIYSRGFFSFANEDNGKNFQKLFDIPAKKEITLIHSSGKDFSVLIRKMVYPVEIASLPFNSIDVQFDNFANWETDTMFTVFFDRSSTARFKLPEYGLYHLSEPGNPDNGFLIMNLWPDFPTLPDDENALKPLRYITTQQEFENLFTFDDPTLALERFWTRITGNPDRANSIKNKYNQRVVEANKYFSSFMPGWQTDRGMIYIVFGPPDKAVINESGENWYYNEQLNIPGKQFEFIKYDNSFPTIHMVLKRNPTYRNSWNIAVERWRR